MAAGNSCFITLMSVSSKEPAAAHKRYVLAWLTLSRMRISFGLDAHSRAHAREQPHDSLINPGSALLADIPCNRD